MLDGVKMSLLGMLLTSGLVLAGDRPNLEATVEFEWSQLDYKYASTGRKNLYLQDPNFFIPENAMISGIAVYNNYIYVTLPRVKSAVGVPWVLGVVHPYGADRHNSARKLIKPFPDWDLQAVGNCNELQNPLAMEVDPNTGLLYVVDSGWVGTLSSTPIAACPAKILVYNLRSLSNQLVSSHTLPDTVVPRNTSLLTSIVLDYKYPHSDDVRYAYIADAGNNKLIVYDFMTKQTWSYFDSSMLDHDRENITINGQRFDLNFGLSGLALSPDFNYIYWSAMMSDKLYQMPTWPLRSLSVTGAEGMAGMARYVGQKASNTDDMVHGKDSLYYGALTKDAIYRWEKRHDMLEQHVPEDLVQLQTQSQLVQNWETLQWPDTLCLDESGDLWFTASRAHLFLSGTLNLNESNFRIFKLPVSDVSYLLDKVPTGPVVG